MREAVPAVQAQASHRIALGAEAAVAREGWPVRLRCTRIWFFRPVSAHFQQRIPVPAAMTR